MLLCRLLLGRCRSSTHRRFGLHRHRHRATRRLEQPIVSGRERGLSPPQAAQHLYQARDLGGLTGAVFEAGAAGIVVGLENEPGPRRLCVWQGLAVLVRLLLGLADRVARRYPRLLPIGENVLARSSIYFFFAPGGGGGGGGGVARFKIPMCVRNGSMIHLNRDARVQRNISHSFFYLQVFSTLGTTL